jgi:hypothetical protein
MNMPIHEKASDVSNSEDVMKVMRVIGRLLILVVVPVVLFGCGGGGSAGDVAASKTRMLKPGDSWTYDVSGHPLNSQTSSYSGTITISITQETLNGEPVLAQTAVQNVTFSGSSTSSSVTSVQYYQQDPSTGEIMMYGRKEVNKPVATVTDRPLPVVWPGSWEAGKTVSVNIHYSDGSTDTGTYTVVGQETITTMAGTFPTWKLSFGSGAVSGTSWFVPQLGYYVKNENSVGTSDLRSTTVTGF